MQPLAVDEYQCAALTGYSVFTLQKQRVRGDGIPFVKLGRKVVYRISDIESHLAAHVVQSTSTQVAA